MIRMLTYTATIAATLLITQVAVAGTLFPRVVVSPTPLKPYVDEILKGVGESQPLLRPGQDAHDFALSPSQAKLLAGADIVIVPNLDMSPTLSALLKKNKRAKIIELTALSGAAPLPYLAENPWLDTAKAKAGEENEDAPKSPHNESPIDPHLWLDPGRMAALAPALANAIAVGTPEAKPTLDANASALARHLALEDLPALRAMLVRPVTVTTAMGKPQIPFLTYHAGYQYFLQQFGLKHYGELTQRPEELLGAKTAGNMQAHASSVRIRCLIGEIETPLMKRIAANSGARMIFLSPEQLPERKDVPVQDWIKNDYDRFLFATAKVFAECLD